MLPSLLRREFPAPSMAVFFALQSLDVLTTLIGLNLGAKEASMFVGRLLQLGPVSGLLISKCFAIILQAAAFAFRWPRGVLSVSPARPGWLAFLNYWFAALVAWNLYTILSSLAAARA